LHHNKLTLSERKLIALWKKQGLSIRECARRLDRSHSTVVREIKRNSFQGKQSRFYEPLHAQGKAETKRKKAWGVKHPLKNPGIYAFVLEKLRSSWSPEQIAGRLRFEYPNDQSWWICHETIYRFIYHPNNKSQAWWEYLRRKQKRRREKGKRKAHRVRIPDRVSIHKRPKVVDQRKEFGHWEGDTVVGKNRNNGLHTTYERVSSLTRFEKMNDLGSLASFLAQKRIYQVLPPKARKTTTLDNGSEHVLHHKLKNILGIQSFFADPYCSWQRGGNENANLWIRYYFPKGTDFRTIADEELKDVEWELNNRPRKRLGYQTPLEVFTFHLVQS